MRSTALAGSVFLLLLGPSFAAGPEAEKKTIQRAALELPQTTEDCLSAMDTVQDTALTADLLDDQVTAAELELARMEENCLDHRFAEAMEAAREVERIVASNK